MGDQYHSHSNPVSSAEITSGFTTYIAGRFASFNFIKDLQPSKISITSIVLYILAILLASNPDTHLLVAVIIFILAGILLRASIFLRAEDPDSDNLHKMFCLSVRYMASGIFYAACAVSVYRDNSDTLYLYAAIFSFFIWAYLATFISRYATERPGLFYDLLNRSNLAVIQEHSSFPLERGLFKVLSLFKEDCWAILLLIFGCLQTSDLLVWSSFVLLAVYFLTVIRLLRYTGPEVSGGRRRSEMYFFFYIIGALVLIYLIARLPFNDIVEVFHVVGPEVLLLILFPALWALPYAMTLKVLLDNRISFLNALYTQVSGDGFNSVTPLLNMGGEPYKAKHLSRFVGLSESSRAIIQSRLVHALSGVIMTALVLMICSLVVDFSNLPGLKFAVIAVMTIMFLVSGLLIWITMSKAPSHLTQFLLTRFKLIEEYTHVRLPWGKMIAATAYRILGRCSKFLEVYLIFIVLDINPSFADLVLVQAMILTSVSLFFFIPQGLGVNEAGIVAAFEIAGYSAATGVVFGLIRRSRMVIYAMTGLLIYLAGSYYFMKKSKNTAGKTLIND